GVRGEVRFFDERGTLGRRLLPSFPQGGCIRYFLSDESTYKVHYIYALFHTEKLGLVDLRTLSDPYCPDCFFVYTLLQHGWLRSTSNTYLNCRIHAANLGGEYSKKWKGWRKILYRIHPLGYYLTYPLYTRNRLDRLLIYLMIPIKHAYAQVFFWFRGTRQLVFRRKFY
ncbi:MAG: hypothetical protein M0037_04365, partial [Betaproteobacteria bacterium]|nr:hypothetical protein [Betaproteobacteria bacterium]